MCLSCNLADGDIRPCLRGHLEQRSQINSKVDTHGHTEAVSRKRPKRGRAKRVASHMLHAIRGSDESLFMHKLSNKEDSEYLDARKANKHVRLLAAMLKLEPGLNRMLEYGRRIPYSTSIMAPYNMLSTGANAIRASVTPAGYYHLGLKFGPLVFESGVKR